MATVMSTEIFVGNVGKIYELRNVGKDNIAVLEFSVAMTPRKRDAAGEWSDGPTTWKNVKAWGRLAENIAEHWKAGDKVFVWGRSETQEDYVDKKTGESRKGKTSVVAEFAGHDNNVWGTSQEHVKNGSAPSSSSSSSTPKASKPATKKAEKPSDDDLDLGLDDDDDLDEDLPF